MGKRGRKPLPTPADIAERVQTMTLTQLVEHYDVAAKVVRRWIAEDDLPDPVEPARQSDPIRTSKGRAWQSMNTPEKLAAIITPHFLSYFWERVQKGVDDDCWIWCGPIHKARGYGSASLGGRPTPAHRASWMVHRGVIPADMFVLHKCDNPPCVNPNHLFLGTNQDNYDDRDAKDRVRHGSKHPRARLTEALVLEIRASSESDSVWAKRLGVYATTIRDARRGAKWKRVPGANPGFYEKPNNARI